MTAEDLMHQLIGAQAVDDRAAIVGGAVCFAFSTLDAVLEGEPASRPETTPGTGADDGTQP